MTCPSATCEQLQLRSRFLHGFAPGELDCILAASSSRQILANSIVTNQGDPAQYIFLLTKGRARFFLMTQNGDKILLHWLTPGEIFGGIALLSVPSVYLVSTETVINSCVLVWDHGTIRRLVARFTKLLENMLLISSDYLALYVATHLALTCQDARQRLARVLANLACSIGREAPGGVELDATNEELAGAANVTLFTASRFLSEWQRQGILRKTRGKVLLRFPERLFSIVA